MEKPYNIEFTQEPGPHDLKVTWEEGPVSYDQLRDVYHYGIVAYHATELPYLSKMTMRISLHAKKGQPRNPQDLKTAILHETGHAFGLEEHSTNPHDIMYNYPKEVSAPSPRDIRSLQVLYQHPATLTNPITRHIYE